MLIITYLNNNLSLFFFREEIPITLSDRFAITIPVDKSKQSTESKCGEDEAVCFSGPSLSLLIDPAGCEVCIIYF